MFKLSKVLAGLVLICSVSTSYAAATLSLSPSSSAINQGEFLMIDLLMDFSADPTLGGALDLFYDEASLSFISFMFDPLFLTDPFFTSAGDASVAGVVSAISFGDFNTGISGPAVVGSFTFEAIGTGTSLLTMAENILPLGGFFSFADSSDQTPVFVDASVEIKAVPLPAAAWLFLSGLIGLIGCARVKK